MNLTALNLPKRTDWARARPHKLTAQVTGKRAREPVAEFSYAQAVTYALSRPLILTDGKTEQIPGKRSDISKIVQKPDDHRQGVRKPQKNRGKGARSQILGVQP